MNTQTTLSQRLRRFGALVTIIFTMTTGVVVTQRLSSDALALLMGLGAGVVLMVPTLALGALVWRRETTRSQYTLSQNQPQTATPPVIVVTPQALPNYGPGQQPWGQPGAPAATWAAGPAERKFTIVGGNE